jgi:hypothetical protein
MRPPARLLIALLAAALASGFAGCSDAWIASRDDQHIPSVPPAKFEGNPLNMPTPNQNSPF